MTDEFDKFLDEIVDSEEDKKKIKDIAGLSLLGNEENQVSKIKFTIG